MAANTAKGAEKKNTRTITFKTGNIEIFIRSACRNADTRMNTIRHWFIVLGLTGISG